MNPVTEVQVGSKDQLVGGLNRLYDQGRGKYGESFRGLLFLVVGMVAVGKGNTLIKTIKEVWSETFTVSMSAALERSFAVRPDGKKLQQMKDSGQLLPDDLTWDALLESMEGNWSRIKNLSQPIIILDGFPRTSGQVELFRQGCHVWFPGLAPVSILMEDIPEGEVYKRLSGKPLDRGDRTDDLPCNIPGRIESWRKNRDCYQKLAQVVDLHLSVPTMDPLTNLPLSKEGVIEAFGQRLNQSPVWLVNH